MSRAAYLQLLTQILRLNVREGLLLDVGTVFDLAALEVRRRNPKKEV